MYMMLMPRRNYDLFDDFFNDPFFRGEEKRVHPLMRTDIRENENSYVIDVDLPGFEKKDIRIDVVITGRYAGNLTCLSSITGGNTYTINNMSDFAKTLIQSATSKTDINTNTQQYEFYED